MTTEMWRKCQVKTFFEGDGSIIPDSWWVVFKFAPMKGNPAVAYVPLEEDADRIIADHNLAQWAREHGRPALIRHGTALARESLALYPSAAEGE